MSETQAPLTPAMFNVLPVSYTHLALWLYRLDEGARGTGAVRQNNRGLAYWSDGSGDDRVLLISAGYGKAVRGRASR